jgi:lipoprotein NlpD
LKFNFMRMKKYSFIGLMSVACLLAACSSQKYSAPVMERNADGQLVEVQRTQPAAKPVPVAPAQPSGPGYYTVKKGDTLTRIALDNGQNYRDLVTWNNLANPNDIKVDQVLRVLPPTVDTGNANGNGGVQLSSVPTQDTAVRSSLNAPPGTAAAATAASTGAVSNANKTVPRGDKRPYSDAALAELQKPDAAPSVAVVASTATSAAPTAADTAAEAPVASDESVSWMWPADGKLVGSYEDAKKGVDIAGKSGQQVVAAASGKVLYAGTMRGYGNLVIVKHSANFLSAYAHNKTILVKEGQSVTKGQQIAEMGDTDTDSVKLHFEVRQQGKPVDPTKYLPPR